MKNLKRFRGYGIPALILGALAFGLVGCQGHRRDEQPTPDGDTVEVVIKEPVTISEIPEGDKEQPQ